MSANCTAIKQLDFSIKAEDVVPRIEAAIANANQVLDKIGSLLDEECTVENVIEAMSRQESEFRIATAAIGFLKHSSADKELRDASTKAEQLTDDYGIEKATREDLFRATKALIKNLGDQINDLEPETKRFIDKLMLGFKHAGLDLPADKRIELKELMKKLADLENTFSKNIAEYDAKILFTVQDLEGCTEDFLETLPKETVDGAEYYVATTKYPDVSGISRYAKNPATRERIDIAFNRRAFTNEPVLEEAVRIRAQCAQLLGYATHADLVLEDRLAKNRENVLRFEKELQDRLKPLGENDLALLKAIKAEDLGVPVEEVVFYSWDNAYYSRLLMERDYSVDENKVKEYFEASFVVPEMLRIYEQVLGLKFTPTKELSVWHEDAMAFQVNDAVSGDLVGFFYLDLHPRDGKYTHAACFPLIPGYLRDPKTSDRQVPIVAVLTNFSKPTVTRPSLLKHSEVVTLFHELGHAMHGMCAKTRYSRFHGTAVERDFVEAPSQMLENWCWDKATLKRLSKHYQTGEPLKDDLIERLIKTDKFMAGLGNLRQIFFGLFDMTIHSVGADLKLPTGDETINDLYARMKAEITLIPGAEGTCPAASFGHMMGGYDAGYYGYLWSKVFSSDMFASRFEAEGLENQVTGMSYRMEILYPGGSRDGMDSIRGFLGREPNQDAFLRSIGL